MPLSHQELRQRRLALLAAPTKAAPDAQALLDAANDASQTVAVLHVAFMAVCAYVLVIVFGTTDLDLLMGGNNVNLPVIDVAVPIVGFYAVAPYLVVLMHLNLLLQLQLLSRKLFAFDAATPAEEGVGGLRDRLHIFPYTYYLVGRPGAVVGGLLGLVVSVTLIMLPLATLLALQLTFLAYQAEGITWAQRFAVFLDVGLLVALWPVILDPSDDWKAWWHRTIAAHLPRKRAWLAVIVLLIGVALVLFAATPDLFTVGLILGVAAPLLLFVLGGGFPDKRVRRTIVLFAVLLGLLAVIWVLMWGSANSLPTLQPAIPVALFLGALPLAFFWHPTAPHARGNLALLSALVLAPLLTLSLMVDGEGWETAAVAAQKPLLAWRWFTHSYKRDRCTSIDGTALSCFILAEQRRLDLNEQVLFAKPLNPELRAALRAGNGLENKDKLEPIFLVNRSLRHAQMRSALLVGADLRRAQLQGADLSGARLQGADLSEAQLQGVESRAAQLQGADLSEAQFQLADLLVAQLQGADLSGTQLQGAFLYEAQLQGADLRGARLQGADLSESTLYVNDDPAQSDLMDVRGANVTPLSPDDLSKIQAMLKSIPFSGQTDSLKQNRLQNLEAATKPGAKAPMFASCLTDGESQPRCQQAYDATNLKQRREFVVRLHKTLTTLSCEDPHIASGILGQISNAYGNSTRAGLATVLLTRMKANEPCPGLAGLSVEDKTKLEKLAKEEAEQEQTAKVGRPDRR